MRGFLLPDQDSNPDKQDQNLVCYHYTIGQSLKKFRVLDSVSLFAIANVGQPGGFAK